MKLFGGKQSKEDRIVKERAAINSTLDKMRVYVADLQPKKQLFIAKVKEAHAEGAKAQEASARAALKQTVCRERMAKQMLLNFEIMVGMRDLTELSGEFMKGMTIMSKQMAKLTEGMNFKKVEKEFNSAMLEAGVQTEKMNEFLEKLSLGLDMGFDGSDALSDEDLDAIIGYATPKHESDAERILDAELFVGESAGGGKPGKI